MRDDVCACVSHCDTPLYMISHVHTAMIQLVLQAVGLVVMEIAVVTLKIKVAILKVETTEVTG